MTEEKPASTYSAGHPDGKSDPTGNVLQLVEAAMKRQDDLRVAETKRLDDLRLAETIRLNDIRGSEVNRINSELSIRAEYEGKLRDAEAKRIDAIRAVDVNAVAVASERAADQATVLANQVAASAETLRNLVATTATTQAAQLGQITTQLTDRLASLEKAQYEGTGKQAVTDPQMAIVLNELKDLRQREFEKSGSGSGMSSMLGWIVSGIFLLLAIAGFAFTVLSKR